MKQQRDKAKIKVGGVDQLVGGIDPVPQASVSSERVELRTATTKELLDIVFDFALGGHLRRKAARDQLNSLDAPSLITLITWYRHIHATRLLALWMPILLLIFLNWFVTLNESSINSIGTFIVSTLLISIGVIHLAVTKADRLYIDPQKLAAVALAAIDDMSAVPGMIDSLETSDPLLLEIVRPSLTRLFAQFLPEDAPIITGRRKKIIQRYLDEKFRAEFSRMEVLDQEITLRIAMLKAVQSIGDVTFSPILRKLAAGKGFGSVDRVRDAATSCILALDSKTTSASTSKGLLRPSNSAANEGGELLRSIGKDKANEISLDQVVIAASRPDDPTS